MDVLQVTTHRAYKREVPINHEISIHGMQPMYKIIFLCLKLGVTTHNSQSQTDIFLVFESVRNSKKPQKSNIAYLPFNHSKLGTIQRFNCGFHLSL